MPFLALYETDSAKRPRRVCNHSRRGRWRFWSTLDRA